MVTGKVTELFLLLEGGGGSNQSILRIMVFCMKTAWVAEKKKKREKARAVMPLVSSPVDRFTAEEEQRFSRLS